MNTAEQALLVILGAALAVLLAVAIVFFVTLIRLLKTLQSIADRAETFVDSAEAAASMVRSTVGKLSLLRFVHTVVDMVQHKASKKGE